MRSGMRVYGVAMYCVVGCAADGGGTASSESDAGSGSSTSAPESSSTVAVESSGAGETVSSGPVDTSGSGSSADTSGSSSTDDTGTSDETGDPLSACPPFPAFPDENCTGWEHTGVTLEECVPDGYIYDSDVAFDSCYFPNGLVVVGANVTITRSHVHGTVGPHWSNDYDLQNLTLVDVEIEEDDNLAPTFAAVAGHNYSCLRCNVHHTGTGIHVGNNAVVEDSYTHDFIFTEGAHGAGIGAGQGHGNGARIVHNNIQCNRLEGQEQICSSALSLYDEPTIDDVLVQNNLFNTVGGYCTYGGGTNGTNIRYLENRFGKKYHEGCGGYGPVAVFYPDNTGNQWEDNEWEDGSGPVDPP